MPATPDTDRPDLSDQSVVASPLSRRSLIKQATAAGATAVAAGLALNNGTAAAAGRVEEQAPGPHRNPPEESLVVRVVDARTGELDFFCGHRHHRVRDAELAAELLRASR